MNTVARCLGQDLLVPKWLPEQRRQYPFHRAREATRSSSMP